MTGADGTRAPPPTVLGSNGLPATKLGLGLAALGRPAYITLGRGADLGDDRTGTTMEQRCHDMLDAAVAAGVGYVDAARSYGRAEEFLSSWLRARSVPPGALTVGSKWGYRYVGDWRLDAAVHETKDHSLSMLREQLPQSVALLGPHLRLYQIHSVTLESGVLEDDAVRHALAELRDSGMAVGLSVSGPRQAEVIRRALDVSVDGAMLFSTVQATWNLLETSAGGALAEAHSCGCGVLVKEALANGRLTDRAAEQSERSEQPVPATRLRQWALRSDTTADRLALAVAAAQPWADVVLSGAVTVAQLWANLNALQTRVDDADSGFREGDLVGVGWGSLAEDPEQYWRTRAALPWH
jgi:aryl-alcohol dehydrogenase-like predicted oxidoreductase